MSPSELPGASPWFGPSLEAILGDIREILESGHLVNGKHLPAFEARIAEMAGTPHAVAVNSGGTALELALLALNVAGREVIVPTQTFIASANAVTRAGGIPVFADIEKDTLCLDPAEVERKIGPNTCGVMFVPMFGLVPSSLLRIKELCKQHGLFLIEDAAHAHGASLDGHPAGSFGDIACFSFFATKVITTGEGGAITTASQDLREKVASLRDHGRTGSSPLFGAAGNNFRLTEMQAVLGQHQLASLQDFLRHRNRIAGIYRAGLESHPLIASLPECRSGTNAYWRYPAYLAEGLDRGSFQRSMWEHHRIRVTWMYEPLCHLQPVSKPRDGRPVESLPVAEWCIDRLVNLPTHLGVSEQDAKRVVVAVRRELDQAAR